MQYNEMKQILLALDDPVQKLEMVMDFGANMSAVPESATCHEILGCASRAEICIDGNHFYGRADSAIVRGIIAILVAMVDGHTPDEIRKMNLLEEFSSLDINLGAGRLNGINSMVRFLQNL